MREYLKRFAALYGLKTVFAVKCVSQLWNACVESSAYLATQVIVVLCKTTISPNVGLCNLDMDLQQFYA